MAAAVRMRRFKARPVECGFEQGVEAKANAVSNAEQRREGCPIGTLVGTALRAVRERTKTTWTNGRLGDASLPQWIHFS